MTGEETKQEANQQDILPQTTRTLSCIRTEAVHHFLKHLAGVPAALTSSWVVL